MITNVNKGVCHARIQQGEPPYFVNWKENGEQRYLFFSQVAPMYQTYERLKKQAA